MESLKNFSQNKLEPFDLKINFEILKHEKFDEVFGLVSSIVFGNIEKNKKIYLRKKGFFKSACYNYSQELNIFSLHYDEISCSNFDNNNLVLGNNFGFFDENKKDLFYFKLFIVDKNETYRLCQLLFPIDNTFLRLFIKIDPIQSNDQIFKDEITDQNLEIPANKVIPVNFNHMNNHENMFFYDLDSSIDINGVIKSANLYHTYLKPLKNLTNIKTYIKKITKKLMKNAHFFLTWKYQLTFDCSFYAQKFLQESEEIHRFFYFLDYLGEIDSIYNKKIEFILDFNINNSKNYIDSFVITYREIFNMINEKCFSSFINNDFDCKILFDNLQDYMNSIEILNLNFDLDALFDFALEKLEKLGKKLIFFQPGIVFLKNSKIICRKIRFDDSKFFLTQIILINLLEKILNHQYNNKKISSENDNNLFPVTIFQFENLNSIIYKLLMTILLPYIDFETIKHFIQMFCIEKIMFEIYLTHYEFLESDYILRAIRKAKFFSKFILWPKKDLKDFLFGIHTKTFDLIDVYKKTFEVNLFIEYSNMQCVINKFSILSSYFENVRIFDSDLYDFKNFFHPIGDNKDWKHHVDNLTNDVIFGNVNMVYEDHEILKVKFLLKKLLDKDDDLYSKNNIDFSQPDLNEIN
ncbi:hypothetical protein GVAV_002927 [Gurleya vavrai]